MDGKSTRDRNLPPVICGGTEGGKPAIVTAAAVGILFFVSVSLTERVALRGYVRQLD